MTSPTAIDPTLDEVFDRPGRGPGQPALDLLHVGTADVTVRDIVQAIRRTPGLAPPRSGHLGDWGEIWAGRSGLIDYNRYICRDLDAGLAQIYCHTTTETGDLSGGDLIYLPGGRVTAGDYQPLRLFVNEAGSLREIDRAEPRCVAFLSALDTATDRAGTPQPLVALHCARLQELGIPFVTNSQALLRWPDRLQALLEAVLHRAAASDNRDVRLGEIVSAGVTLTGRRAARPVFEGALIRFDDGRRCTVAEVARDAVTTLSVAVEPELLNLPAGELPSVLPLLSTGVTALLNGFLMTHQPHGAQPSPGDVITHLHWGAVSMAGYPPRNLGYLMSPSNRRRLTRMATEMSEDAADGCRLRFALLPAPVLSLLPSADLDGDVEATEELFTAIGGLAADTAARAEPVPGDVSPHAVLQGRVDGAVTAWASRWWSRVSPYYRSRFTTSRTVLNTFAVRPRDGRPHVSDGFLDLTFQEATLLLGALLEVPHV